jgi:hypothetical protein
MEAHSGDRARPVATGSALLEFEVVQSAEPSSAEPGSTEPG